MDVKSKSCERNYDDFISNFKRFAQSFFNDGIPGEVAYIYKNHNMNIFVAGLPYDLDDAELEEIFEKFGKVISAKVAIDRETGKSKGFGFVEMPIEAEAKDAIENLNDISLGNKPLVVKAAEDRPGGAGGGGGGFRNRNDRGGGGGFNSRPGNNRDRRRF
jgi:cold-inducible RNA-binding protein